jgi:adenylate cyclase
MAATQRKLTTIFSADVQGYSRLMEADEERTLATLKQYRDAMMRLIEAHGGRVVNTWGDGLIAEFPSVVESVRAAIDVQNELAGRNAGLPSESRMEFRIGINLGDVIADGEDIYGDGVNIAARLQTSAAPGGIVISSTVHDQVRNKMTVGFEFLGQLSVKNISEGVPSYAVQIGERRGAPAYEARVEPEASNPASTGQWGRATDWTQVPSRKAVSRSFSVMGLIVAGLVAINLLTWGGTFWAVWPLLAACVLAGLSWARTTNLVDRRLASLGVIGAMIVAINFLSRSDTFWAKWPLLAIVIAAGLSLIMRRKRA